MEKTKKDVEAKHIIHQEEIELLRMRIRVQNEASPIALEREFIEKALPKLAEVMAMSMKDMKIQLFQQDGKGGTPINFMLAQLMDIWHSRSKPLSTNSSERKE